MNVNILLHLIKKKSNAPESIGRISVYFRKSMDDGSRRLFERLRFPVTRYNNRHFRTFLIAEICHNSIQYYVTSYSIDGTIR
jgi:hypothetical protein